MCCEMYSYAKYRVPEGDSGLSTKELCDMFSNIPSYRNNDNRGVWTIAFLLLQRRVSYHVIDMTTVSDNTASEPAKLITVPTSTSDLYIEAGIQTSATHTISFASFTTTKDRTIMPARDDLQRRRII